MGALKSKMRKCFVKEPIYNRTRSAHTTNDPGRSFDEMLATVRSFGIDPQNPTDEDMANLEWLREIRAGRDAAEVEADKARWKAQAKALAAMVPRNKPKRYKPKVPQTPAEEAVTAERRAQRRTRNEARRRRKELQGSRELVSLH
mmetsp:Transcript_6278/g.10257  ORF Transcript_6278/g.10257 Transcript_6278/m.10257 type:complete len:145 (-) Transcript_6278:542-976(-)|eukprot:CAMPEP_0114431934 /NCGR_PEP_ID=MMETSP0103-20121206/10881_1 /TAXON_ID=37642 ORGANISM="Paraphysomonas imperforata, Strain PA2" /NCGR_SAMPLE_ID=MMETSP0103 /ASSEMBLY_ACC=CAM_ASM_000201 /LENGTH=144 /DNA_ID=CAMNT_0001601565 /DNA_START=79 /DNA_END=513 /DNA_ORIENTATION=-